MKKSVVSLAPDALKLLQVKLEKMNEFLTKKEVAEKLRVTTRTINNYMAQGKLSFIRLSPKIVFFRATEIEAFLEENTAAA